jgi:hypothetical protein
MAFLGEYGLGVGALAIYILGGIGVFAGIGMVALMGGQNLWGWGDGGSIGYLLLFVGAGLSVFGVLLMRIFRNRLPVPKGFVGN